MMYLMALVPLTVAQWQFDWPSYSVGADANNMKLSHCYGLIKFTPNRSTEIGHLICHTNSVAENEAHLAQDEVKYELQLDKDQACARSPLKGECPELKQFTVRALKKHVTGYAETRNGCTTWLERRGYGDITQGLVKSYQVQGYAVIHKLCRNDLEDDFDEVMDLPEPLDVLPEDEDDDDLFHWPSVKTGAEAATMKLSHCKAELPVRLGKVLAIGFMRCHTNSTEENAQALEQDEVTSVPSNHEKRCLGRTNEECRDMRSFMRRALKHRITDNKETKDGCTTWYEKRYFDKNDGKQYALIHKFCKNN